MLKLLEDRAEGIHDMLLPACDKCAYQREFDRLANGMEMNFGVPAMQARLPVLNVPRRDHPADHDGHRWFSAAGA
jgi:hypothetical protein